MRTPIELPPEDNRVIISRAEARARNLRFFYTGNPCVHGHLTMYWTCNGRCYQCQLDASRKAAKKYNAKRREKPKALMQPAGANDLYAQFVFGRRI